MEQYSLSLAPAADFLACLLSVFAVDLHAFMAYLAKQNMCTQQISHIEHEQKTQFCRLILKSKGVCTNVATALKLDQLMIFRPVQHKLSDWTGASTVHMTIKLSWFYVSC